MPFCKKLPKLKPIAKQKKTKEVSSTLGDFLAFLALDFPADRCPGKQAEISY